MSDAMTWDVLIKLAALVGLCTPVCTMALILGRFFWRLDKKLDLVIEDQRALVSGFNGLLRELSEKFLQKGDKQPCPNS
jgi:hypothetical protein